MRTKLLVMAAVTGAALWTSAPAAMAKGGSLDPVEDRYEVGETATLIGYGGDYGDGDLDVTDSSENGPFTAYLRVDEAAVRADNPDNAWGVVHPTDLPLGAPVVEALPEAEETFYSVRVSLTFVVPDVKPGTYEILVCNDPCTTGPGGIMSGIVTVGMDPAVQITRMWPVSEPMIAELDPDALVWVPGKDIEVTAAEIRGEIVPTRPETEPARTTTAKAGADRASDDDGGSGAAMVLGGGGLVLGGLVLLARRFGPSRKRVTRTDAMSSQVSPGLRSGPPKRIRL